MTEKKYLSADSTKIDSSDNCAEQQTNDNTGKPIFVKLPVTWEMCGYVNVATTDGLIKTAIEVFKETCDDIPLPDDKVYVDSSFVLTTEIVEDIAVMTSYL